MKNIQLFFLLIIFQFSYAQEGRLDLAFGESGTVLTMLSDYEVRSYGSAIQRDGKILLCGDAEHKLVSDRDIIIIRYHSDGTIDESFADNGIFIHDSTPNQMGGSSYDNCRGITVDFNGNIYFSGGTDLPDDSTKGTVGKLFSNGILDANFGVGGFWRSDQPSTYDSFSKVEVLDSGKIIVGGHRFHNISLEDCAIIRLNANGSIDTSFGNLGYCYANGMSQNYTIHIDKMDENKLYVCAKTYFFPYRVSIQRFTEDGLKDLSFHEDGDFIDDFHISDVNGFKIQKDGKFIVGITSQSDQELGVIRYLPDGSKDLDFGNEGIAIEYFGESYGNPSSVILQDDEKIILIGHYNEPNDSNYAMVRFDKTGELDPSFGNQGRVLTDIESEDYVQSTILCPNNKLLLSGQSGSAWIGIISMAQYHIDAISRNQEIAENITDFIVSPNPSSGHVQVCFNLYETIQLSIDLLSAEGIHLQEIATPSIFQRGQNKLSIDLPVNISNGIYLLKIGNQTEHRLHKLIIYQ